MQARRTLTAPLTLLACAAAGVLQAGELDSTNLDAAEKIWANAAVRSYEFTFEYNVFVSPCKLRTVHFKVANGKPLSKWRCRDLQAEFGSVPRLFDFLRRALAAGHASIDAEFDPRYGYPQRVFVDFGAVDFFEGFSVSSFRTNDSRSNR